jgi:chromosome segregation ATPase
MEKKKEMEDKELKIKLAKNKYEQVKRDLDNKKREVKDSEFALAHYTKSLELLEKEREISKEIGAVIVDGIKSIEPNKEFETNEKYWDLMKELQKIENEKKILQFNQGEKQIRQQIKSHTEQLESLRERIPIQEKEVAELHKEYLKLKR